ncbi:MAG: hypothetical protein JRJ87_19560 [Deltaproteobacteria bacterium]|nr:hypothetical protein [Deltaproteobacteria bacterium]
MKLSLFGIVSLSLLFICAGCGGGGTSDSCNLDDDCPRYAICIHGECQKTACMEDDDCVGTLICVYSYCAKPECNYDDDCQAKEHCDQNRCEPGQCRQDSDCDQEFHCEAYECVSDICYSDSDCLETEICVDGVCELVIECVKDQDCPQWQVCYFGDCIPSCFSTMDCEETYLCQNGHCYQWCIDDDSCYDNRTICENGVCIPAECMQDQDCEGQQERCIERRCIEIIPCETDQDCGSNFVCLANICVELPICVIDDHCKDSCSTIACVCRDEHCHPVETCNNEEECGADFDCIGGVCVEHYCRGPAECEQSEECVFGICQSNTNPSAVVQVVVLSKGGPIKPAQEIQIHALALDINGEDVPAVTIDWSSTHPLVAGVDDVGLLTGGNQVGSTQVTAQVQGSSIISDPVTFSLVNEVAQGTLRVIVIDFFSRQPVADATVRLEYNQTSQEAQTDAVGQAAFDDPEMPADLHVFSSSHDYVSVFRTTAKDLLVPISPRSGLGQAGGMTGKMVLPGGNNTTLGLAGCSLSGNLARFSYAQIMGEFFGVAINIGSEVIRVLVNSQVVINYSYLGFPLSVKDTFYSLGNEGHRTVWAFGGGLDSTKIASLFDTTDTDEILLALLPYFSTFEHALVPMFEVVLMPRVQDIDDINGDQSTEDIRPDWASFDYFDLEPTVPLVMGTMVTPPLTPHFGGLPIRTTLISVNSLTEWGLTPLGLNSSEAFDGIVAPTLVKAAPVYGGLQHGAYVVLAIALPKGTTIFIPNDMAMVAYGSKDLPIEVSFDSDFLAFPEDAQYNSEQRQMTATAIDQATLYLGTHIGTQGTWEVYLPATGPVDYVLPSVPNGMDDLSTSHSFILSPIKLKPGISFTDLLSFNGQDLDRINHLILAATRFQL